MGNSVSTRVGVRGLISVRQGVTNVDSFGSKGGVNMGVLMVVRWWLLDIRSWLFSFFSLTRSRVSINTNLVQFSLVYFYLIIL